MIEIIPSSLPKFEMSCSQAHTTFQTAREKMVANPPRTFYAIKIIKCPTQYLPPFSRSCLHTLRRTIPYCSVTQGIYVIIYLSLRSNRQNLSRQQGIILIKPANAVITSFSIRHTIDRKWNFLGKSRVLQNNTQIGKRTEWHATAFNGRFGAIGALPRVEKYFVFLRRRLALKKCESPACAKPLGRYTNMADKASVKL